MNYAHVYKKLLQWVISLGLYPIISVQNILQLFKITSFMVYYNTQEYKLTKIRFKKKLNTDQSWTCDIVDYMKVLIKVSGSFESYKMICIEYSSFLKNSE